MNASSTPDLDRKATGKDSKCITRVKNSIIIIFFSFFFFLPILKIVSKSKLMFDLKLLLTNSIIFYLQVNMIHFFFHVTAQNVEQEKLVFFLFIKKSLFFFIFFWHGVKNDSTSYLFLKFVFISDLFLIFLSLT